MKLAILVVLVLCWLASAACAQTVRAHERWAICAQASEADWRVITQGENLAVSRRVEVRPAPNHGLSAGPRAGRLLTDGKLRERSDERIWFEKGAVCWQHSPLITIFADLEQPQPIAEVVIRLLGGGEQGSLQFPDEIRVLLSNDGKDYYLVSSRHRRGLDDLSPEAWDLPEENLAWVHNFRLPVGCTARYLAVQVAYQKQFICSDELAVVKGRTDLPAFAPSADKKVTLVTRGVAFFSHHAKHPICATMPLRTKVAKLDARAGKDFNSPCNLVFDLPETVRFVTEGYTPEKVVHDGRAFQRYAIPCKLGKLPDFYLQSLLPAGKTDVLYMYGESGNGLENERRITWESIAIPPARQPKRLHVSLAWSSSEHLHPAWPNYLENWKKLGFNCVACFPRYWQEADVAKHQAVLDAARKAGFAVIVNESPAGALTKDRRQPEAKSQLHDGPSPNACPSYRGQYYQKEHASFAQHAVWCRPDYIFYDIEAYRHGAKEAPRCERCKQRFAQSQFKDWDAFCAAMGKEIHQHMKAAIDKALAENGLKLKITYGSYRTQPATKLNDGLFNWDDLYPNLLQVAMPSLYVAGNAMAVANSISANRALMKTNDLISWLSTGTYGEYDPVRTRDMILEELANGARGITYYYYGNFDPLHFKYHAEAVDLVAPIEDIFVDGAPLTGLAVDNDKVKVCGMALGDEMAVLVSAYAGVKPGTKVKLTLPVKARSQVWDLHSRTRVTELAPGQPLEVVLSELGARMFYIGSTRNQVSPRNLVSSQPEWRY